MHYRIADNLSSRKIADEYFVLDRKQGIVHTFNGTGTFIWERINLLSDFEEIAVALATVFNVDVGQGRKDLFDFVLNLEKKNLVILED